MGVDAGSDLDGRNARRDRNRLSVLDTVLALFREGNLRPRPEEVAERSGVSLRSVYRYYSDPSELLRSAIARHLEAVVPLLHLHAIGQGAFEDRLEGFIDHRLRLYDAIGPTARASRLAAASNDAIAEQCRRRQETLRGQVAAQFAPELDRLPPRRRRALTGAADALTQLETLDYFRLDEGLSGRETREHLVVALRQILSP